ncbi:hydrogenase nickel incorporation protein HypB [Bacteroidota bacterium]
MCDTCGCGEPGSGFTIRKPGEENQDNNHQHTYTHRHTHKHDDAAHEHDHHHAYTHSHEDGHQHHHHDHDHEHKNHAHDHQHSHGTTIEVEQDILQINNLLAERNKGFFEAKNIKALNLVSSPGSGKTSLLERTIKEMKSEMDFFVIEGDQQTMNDANRIEAAGAPVVQINTGNACHLDAEMINKAVKKLEVKDQSILMIENVGNLVCPSLFDLGEHKRIVIMSVTEGDDKPLKYPNMFASSDLCIINKTDLLSHVDFDINKAKEYALRVNHHLEIFELSVKTGEGIAQWYQWLKNL